jgi:integrase
MVMSRQNMPVVVSARSRESRGTPDRGVSGDLTWDRAIRLFLEGWAADHPGIRPRTLGHYRDQLVTRVAAFAEERGIADVREFSRHDLRGFVAWLDGLVTYAGSPLTPRGRQMALDAAKRFLLWLHQERLIPDDITAGVKKYRLDKDPEPRATPSADLPLTICEGKEMVRPEVAGLMASWLRIRSETCSQLGEEDALFVTLGPNQWSRLTARGGEPDPHCRPAGERIKTDAVRVILKRVAAKAGADPKLVTPYRLRHYFGLTSAMAGVPTTALMRAMGHRSPIMTARYSEFADSQRRWAFAKADITKGVSLRGCDGLI